MNHGWRRSKALYLRELIEQGRDDLEDAYLGASALGGATAGLAYLSLKTYQSH